MITRSLKLTFAATVKSVGTYALITWVLAESIQILKPAIAPLVAADWSENAPPPLPPTFDVD